MTLKARDVKKALKTKGFREEKRDHLFYFFQHEGLLTPIHTKISHAETDLHNAQCSQMSRQMKLTARQFENFVDCALTAQNYVDILVRAGHLTSLAADSN